MMTKPAQGNRESQSAPHNSAPATNGARRYRVAVKITREGQEKAFWPRVGTAFVNDNSSITVKLDALPMTGELFLFPDDGTREKDE